MIVTVVTCLNEGRFSSEVPYLLLEVIEGELSETDKNRIRVKYGNDPIAGIARRMGSLDDTEDEFSDNMDACGELLFDVRETTKI